MNVSESPALRVHVDRIRGEYLEMPGLRLSPAQAQRLWGLDADTCKGVLKVLIEEGFLRRTGAGEYVRLTEGSEGRPQPRTAKAHLTLPPHLKAAG